MTHPTHADLWRMAIDEGRQCAAPDDQELDDVGQLDDGRDCDAADRGSGLWVPAGSRGSILEGSE